MKKATFAIMNLLSTCRNIILPTIFILLISTNTKAQRKGLGSWSMGNVQYHINEKWQAWTELQARSYKFYNDFYYHEVKAGIQYNINKSASTLFGTGQYVTYSEGGNFKSPTLTHEWRVWEQMTLTNNIDRLKLEHRYRVEQRWLTAGYRNRFRYRLNAILPIAHKKLEPHTFYLNAFDEIFLTDKKPHFERNRFFAGAGYVFTKGFTFQIGALRQYDYRLNGTTTTIDFLQTSLFFNIHNADIKREPHPGAVD